MQFVHCQAPFRVKITIQVVYLSLKAVYLSLNFMWKHFQTISQLLIISDLVLF